MNEPTITLKPTNPFYDLFPNGIVPVKSARPGPPELEMPYGYDGSAAVYMLDAERLTTEQMDDVAGRVAELFGARVRDVLEELIEEGLPIRASEVERYPLNANSSDESAAQTL